ncbi:MAG TPA: hypothetical protein VNB23_11425 [Ramlibacter sp.]|nr:hypothetical protein [Ramlibacter sp.]
MVAVSKNNFLDHIKLFRSACREAGAEVIVAMESWHAFARQGEKHTVFYPQFQASVAGRLQYQHVLTEDATMFAGWLPYRLKRWDTAVDKLAFKRYAQSVGLNVPAYWLDDREAPADVVVKTPQSSFGQGVTGPYRRSTDRPLDLTKGEYYEQFIVGRLVKIWYWNEQPVCAEVDRLPFVHGNGKSTLAELIVRRASEYTTLDEAGKSRLLARCAPLLRYYGRTPEFVLPVGAKQVIEFRYGAFLMRGNERSVLDLIRGEAPPWLPQVQEAGSRLYDAIPHDIRPGTVFTVDAVLPADGNLRFLEANCNPTVHPLVYSIMARNIMGMDAEPGRGAALLQ